MPMRTFQRYTTFKHNLNRRPISRPRLIRTTGRRINLRTLTLAPSRMIVRQRVRVLSTLRPQRQLMQMVRVSMRHILKRLRPKVTRRLHTRDRHVRSSMLDRTRLTRVVPTRRTTNLRRVARIRRSLITLNRFIVRVINRRRISQLTNLALHTRHNRGHISNLQISPVIHVRRLSVRTYHHHSANIRHTTIALILLVGHPRST